MIKTCAKWLAVFAGIFLLVLIGAIWNDKVSANKSGSPYYIEKWSEVAGHLPNHLMISLVVATIACGVLIFKSLPAESGADDPRIVPYSPVYAHETVAMWRASKEKALGIPDPHEFGNHLAFLTGPLAAENRIWLALDRFNGQVIGMLALAGTELNQLYVHVGHQRRGVGSRLLGEAKRNCPGRLELFTFQVNRNARLFYGKHGFKEISRDHPNEENLPDIRYRWERSADGPETRT